MKILLTNFFQMQNLFPVVRSILRGSRCFCFRASEDSKFLHASNSERKKVAEAKKLCSSNFFSPCSAFVHKVEEKKLI